MTRQRSRSDKTGPAASGALSYTNRKGATYFLHQGTTKTGKPRYFVAKSVRKGALATMPAGYEFGESINGVVSVRRKSTAVSLIPDTDLAMVRAELARHQHLQRHRVEATKDEILVYEPAGGFDPSFLGELGARMYRLSGRAATVEARVNYDPVMKFVPEGRPGHYAIHRMTYRGEGGWSWSLAEGPLQKLVRKYLKHVGTDEFFELM